MSTMSEVKLGKLTLWLLGDAQSSEAALCVSPDDYRNGIVSYAHLCDDGKIRRYHRVIGEHSDLVFTGRTVEAKPSEDAWENLGSPFLGGW